MTASWTRLVTALWFLAGLTPLLAVLGGRSPRRAVLLSVVYFAGCVAIAVGKRRDPRGERIQEFMASRTAGVLGGLLVLAGQWAILQYPGHWVSTAGLAVGAWLLVTWAFSRGTDSFAGLVARHLALGVSGVMVLLAGEAGLWLIAAQRPANDGIRYTWGCPIEQNRWGFREREVTVPKPPDTFRIMLLGDSLTWGAGLRADERYSYLLEQSLRARCPGLAVEVLNFGISGGPTVWERDVLEKHAAEVDPDLVVVGFCVNDPQPKREDYAVEIEQFDDLFRLSRGFWALGLTHTAAFLDDRLTRVLRGAGRIPGWQEALDRVYDASSAEWRDFEKALADIVRINSQRRLPPPLFIALLQGNGDYARPNQELTYYLKWTRQALKAAEQAGFQVISVEQDFATEGDRVRWVNPWDGHPSRECQVTYARRLAEAIEPIVGKSRGVVRQ